MIFNKITWMGILIILTGLGNIFRTTPYKTGGKGACSLGEACLYQGLIFIIIGLIVLGHKIYIWNRDRKKSD
jgi:hypothetical protein